MDASDPKAFKVFNIVNAFGEVKKGKWAFYTALVTSVKKKQCLTFRKKKTKDVKFSKEELEEIEQSYNETIERRISSGGYNEAWKFLDDQLAHLKPHAHTFSKEVALVSLYPGFQPEYFDFLVSSGVKGIVVVSYGTGNGPLEVKERLSSLVKDKNVVVVTCTECLEGLTGSVYDLSLEVILRSIAQHSNINRMNTSRIVGI